MREIKFRTWNGHGFSIVELCPDGTIIKVGVPEKLSNPWQEYINLKDKTGREIYEGDIIRVDEFGMGVVTWEDSGFIIKSIKHLTDAMDIHSEALLEVIGNIYENPELVL